MNPDLAQWNERALVVLSGGQDSTTCLGIAMDLHDEVYCVTFDYGQKHRREIEAAQHVVAYFEHHTRRKIHHEIIKFPEGMFAGRSPLTNPNEELETYNSAEEMDAIIGDRIEKTFVPMRNAVFLMVAANRAAVHDCTVLYTGVCQADNANYPDCREVFTDSAIDTINLALGTLDDQHPNHIRIATPLMDLSKDQSIELAMKTPYTYQALAWSHTAYDGRYPPNGNDHASVLRADGFLRAGVPDPLVIRAYREGLMDLPAGPNYDQFRGSDFDPRSKAVAEADGDQSIYRWGSERGKDAPPFQGREA